MTTLDEIRSLAEAAKEYRLLAPLAATAIWYLWSVTAVTPSIFSARNYYFGPALVINSGALLTVEVTTRIAELPPWPAPLLYWFFGAVNLTRAYACVVVWLMVFIAQALLWRNFMYHYNENTEKLFLLGSSNILGMSAYWLYIRVLGIV